MFKIALNRHERRTIFIGLVIVVLAFLFSYRPSYNGYLMYVLKNYLALSAEALFTGIISSLITLLSIGYFLQALFRKGEFATK